MVFDKAIGNDCRVEERLEILFRLEFQVDER
jgi:hypothetical protein